jgi:NTE family protein
VTNNYPIDEVRKLGADIIIGVDVQDDLRDRNSSKMPQNLGTNYKSSFDRKMKGNIIKRIFTLNRILKISVLYHLIKEKKSS